MLTHLSKTNAFNRRPSVISRNIFLVDSQPPIPPFQCCNTLRGHFHLVTTLKRGEGVEMSKLDIEKLTRLTKQVFIGGVSQLLLSMIVAWHASDCLNATRSSSRVSCGIDDFAHERSDLEPKFPWHFSVLRRRLFRPTIHLKKKDGGCTFYHNTLRTKLSPLDIYNDMVSQQSFLHQQHCPCRV